MAAPSAPAPVVSQRVQISVSCNGLSDKDVTSKSDPMCVLFTRVPMKNASWMELGRTEQIKNNLNPRFIKTFEIDYFFEQRQELRFAVYDVDSTSGSLDQQDFLGEMMTELGEICGARGMTLTRPLKKGTDTGRHGTITVSAEEVKTATQDALKISFGGRKLDKKDFFGLAAGDPFFVVNKGNGSGGWTPVYKSEWIRSSQDVEWKPALVGIQPLCNGDLFRPVRVEVWDWDDDGGHDFIGMAEMTARQLMDRAFPVEGLPLINEKKKAKKGASYKNSGMLLLRDCKVERVYSFLDYLAGGCEISLMVAVDFTGSNGDPRSPDSLHYTGGQAPNQYESALASVGEILSYYDYDKMFHAYGFGGCLPGTTSASHCFALNGNPARPEVAGVPGIIAAYRQAITSVALSGPTYFAPTINMASSVAAQFRGAQQKYAILLIITDGAINDLEATKDAVVKACGLPLSIIIVGVGNADFGSMNILDGDDGALRSKTGGAALRDIVQFVPFRDFRGQHPAALAAAVLAEVPKQLVDYFRLNGVLPNPPIRPGAAPAAAAPAAGAAPVAQMAAVKI